MQTHDTISFIKPKTAKDLKVPPEQVADYLCFTKYGRISGAYPRGFIENSS